MSVAYFIVLDNAEVDFDASVDGKSITPVLDELMGFCKKHHLKTLDDFYGQGAGDVFDEFDELDDLELPEQDAVWFDAEEGIEWISALIAALNHENPPFLSDAILEDFNDYMVVFKNAKNANVKWHLALDF
ncbi:MAG: hypothetical protein AAF512_05455 [Pseudomonadota bacterium]